jgi:hypothetical protein
MGCRKRRAHLQSQLFRKQLRAVDMLVCKPCSNRIDTRYGNDEVGEGGNDGLMGCWRFEGAPPRPISLDQEYRAHLLNHAPHSVDLLVRQSKPLGFIVCSLAGDQQGAMSFKLHS